jgi:N-dimethylarginine dimethylaminohydrolase
MEKNEKDLIAQYIDQDEELRKYVEQHAKFEEILEDLNSKVYLTQDEEIEKKTLQKKKLLGKEKIYEILSKYKDL